MISLHYNDQLWWLIIVGRKAENLVGPPVVAGVAGLECDESVTRRRLSSDDDDVSF